MTRRYIGNATVLIHPTERDGYLCRVTAGRTAVRLTVWGSLPLNCYRTPRAIDAKALQAFEQAALEAPQIRVAAEAGGGLGPNGWIVKRTREVRS